MIELHGWLNRNSLRAFPLREDAVIIAENTGWRIPEGLIVDLFVASPGYTDLCLTSVTVTSRIIAVTFGDPATGETVAAASAVIGAGTPYSPKELIAIAPGASGSVTFGPLLGGAERAWSSRDHGQHIFGSRTRLESRCVLNLGPFPVQSLSPRRDTDLLAGAVTLTSNDQVAIGLSEGTDGGDPVSLITIDLTNPGDFVSPCETRRGPCQCRAMPILSINDVLPDGDGRITIELVDETGTILLFGEHILNFLLTRTSSDICVKPVMPDSYGRLPDPLGDYTGDRNPVTSYQNPADTTFPAS